MEHDLNLLRGALIEATKAIASEYFMLPVAPGWDDGVEPLLFYRERVYAYELYHQLRCRWPWNAGPYSLGGEIDKNGHPLVRGDHLDNAKPDLLVHEPGNMRHNLAVIEIKPATASRARIREDIVKLTAFRKMRDGYASATLLVFGEDIERLLAFDREGLDLDLVELRYHPRVGEPAVDIEW